MLFPGNDDFQASNCCACQQYAAEAAEAAAAAAAAAAAQAAIEPTYGEGGCIVDDPNNRDSYGETCADYAGENSYWCEGGEYDTATFFSADCCVC